MKETITIDLNDAKLLKEEASLISFGAKVKQMLYYMFAEPGQSLRAFQIRGNRPDVMAFGAALASEKAYMDSYLKHGLNDPGVLNNRYRLDKAVEKFEKETGIKWPLK
tara:strand:+ start:9096 stop:9419 length:324 start_codon:yes stop_codon:yes gene_type:complete